MASGKVLIMILAGGKGERLFPLTETRCKPEVPFGSNCKLIDFTLSNCVNSGFSNIQILTQYKSDSLERHIKKWKEIHSKTGHYIKVHIIKSRNITQFKGTADAVRQNLQIIENKKPDHIFILSSDHVYKMDYSVMLKAHLLNNSEVTIGALESDIAGASSFGVIEADKTDRITGFEEKPGIPRSIVGNPDVAYISMGIYVFNYQTLIDSLQGIENDFGKDIIPKLIKIRRVFAYNFIDEIKGGPKYWRDVGTIDSYYEATLDLVNSKPALKLKDPKWPLFTGKIEVSGVKSANSVFSDNFTINRGNIEHSICSTGVLIGNSADITDSILFKGVVIGKGAKVHKAIIDQGVRIPAGTRIGFNITEDRKRFTVSPHGVVVVGAKAVF